MDFVADGRIDGADLGFFLSHWGSVATGDLVDLDSDGVVGSADLTMLIGL